MLGQYVIALLKNKLDLEGLRAQCLNQLDVFLGAGVCGYLCACACVRARITGYVGFFTLFPSSSTIDPCITH